MADFFSYVDVYEAVQDVIAAENRAVVSGLDHKQSKRIPPLIPLYITRILVLTPEEEDALDWCAHGPRGRHVIGVAYRELGFPENLSAQVLGRYDCYILERPELAGEEYGPILRRLVEETDKPVLILTSADAGIIPMLEGEAAGEHLIQAMPDLDAELSIARGGSVIWAKTRLEPEVHAFSVSSAHLTPWKPSEDALIQRYYAEEGFRMMRRLHNRPADAVRIRAAELGISKRAFDFDPSIEQSKF